MNQAIAMSTNWNAKRHTNATGILEEILGLGVQDLELGYSTSPAQLEELAGLLPDRRFQVVSVHNFCPTPPEHRCSWGDDYLLSSLEEAQRQAGVRATLETFEWAQRLGAEVVVMHLGEVAVDKRKFKTIKQAVADESIEPDALAGLVADARQERDDRAAPHLAAIRKSLDDLLPRLPEHMRLGLECRSDYYQIPNVTEAQQLLQDYGDVVGYWHDVGHAYMQELMGFYAPNEYIQTLHPRLIGWHIHDSLRVSDHRPPGTGDIDFSRVLKPYLDSPALRVLELHPRTTRAEVVQGLDYMRANDILR